MKKSSFFSALIAGAVAVSSLAVSVLAADDLVLTKDDCAGLMKVATPDKPVTFATDTYAGICGGEDNGVWFLGGDNGDIGITAEIFSQYKYVEIDYTCDAPVTGVQIGPSFKIHIDMESRLCPDDGYVFYDYLPATWVPYGAGAYGEQIGVAVNSLDTIYQTNLQESGTISIPVEDLLGIFEDDFDYLMGIGLGANNNTDFIATDDLDNGTEYSIVCTAVRLTDTQSENAQANINTLSEDEVAALFGGAAAEETTVAEETTIAAEETTVAEDTAVTTAADTTAAADAPAAGGFPAWVIIAIIAAVAVIIVVVVIVIISSKKKA